MKLCIIGGFPRAGTRQFADILNKINGVSIKGEFYPKVIRSLVQTFTVANSVHEKRWTNDNYSKWRFFSALNAYAAFSKGSNAPYDFKGKNVVGFKSPRAENHFKDLRSLIDFDEVVFFYCIRNIRENFLSESSAFGVSVEEYIDKTISSLRSGLEVKSQPGVTFKTLNLDEYIQSGNKSQWVEGNLLDALGLSGTVPSELENIVSKVKNTNATEEHGKIRRRDLSNSEKEYFQKSTDFKHYLREFGDQCGLEINDLYRL